MTQTNTINTIIPVWKPVNWTSFDVVKKVRGIVKQKKVGHSGTLDPFAEGLLLICTGKSTSMVNSLMNRKKEYTGEIQLGKTTDTLDPESPVTKKLPVQNLNAEHLQSIANSFIGEINQVPPQYSALKVNGKPLYSYARKGIKIDIPPRKVHIYEFEIIKILKDSFTFRIVCGRGTYIRAIARDFAECLGTVGLLKTLKRTRIGNYLLDDAVEIENIKEWLSAKI